MLTYYSYRQLVLLTGNIIKINLPKPKTSDQILQLLEGLNKEALLYGCIYFTMDCDRRQ